MTDEPTPPTATQGVASPPSPAPTSAAEPVLDEPEPLPDAEEAWLARLGAERYEVLRRKGTERPWSGALLDVHDPGLFRCAGCGAALFRSDDKFDSGSGWPSFTRARTDGVIVEHEDRSFGMRRTEITCARCGGHLGHVFPDGPRPTGLRYCVNSLSLTFEPADGTAPAGGSTAGGAPVV
jgi:peptide-methionine (R)-S-oxide reductase